LSLNRLKESTCNPQLSAASVIAKQASTAGTPSTLKDDSKEKKEAFEKAKV
jgi:hypothetical protein